MSKNGICILVFLVNVKLRYVHLVFVLHALMEAEDVGPAGDHPLVVMHHVLHWLPVLENIKISSQL